MRIRSFHIDAFGTLRDVTAEGLPEAGAVFLGVFRQRLSEMDGM